MSYKATYLSVAIIFLGACAAPNVALSPTSSAIVKQASAPDAVQQCPNPDRTSDFAPQFFGAGLGQSPTWAVFSNNGRVSLGDMSQAQQTEHGLPVKLLWAVERTHTEVVTISGTNIQTGEPLWFMLNGETATTSAALDPQQPAIPFQHEGYAEFPGYVLLANPGCYELRATTATEKASWQKHFLVTQ